MAIALGLICRTLGKLTAPAALWIRFNGECIACTPSAEGTQLQVRFTDHHRITHIVTFCTPHPDAAALQIGDAVAIAIRRESFTAGCLPTDTPEPRDARSVFLRAEQKSILRRALLRILVRGVAECGLAIGAACLAIHFCFP